MAASIMSMVFHNIIYTDEFLLSNQSEKLIRTYMSIFLFRHLFQEVFR